ncbi:MICAL-like protein [Schistosoma japonicum]|uniref:MICAL-like protein n=1 Tax=Schistosoma japonicum TaxID=6182 RepID=A0A4Z2DBA7_SCHJA|nr:MICAL-like protein [Schistosoma japonicum]
MDSSTFHHLLKWCIDETKTYQNVNITDFTSSWKDGLAFCALVHKHFPDLIDFHHLKPEDAVKNLELAFFVAETKLNIPVLINPQIAVSEGVDEKLVIDYVSKLYRGITRKYSGQSSSDAFSNNKLLYSSEKEEGLPTCELCGETVFSVEQLTVFSRNYHRSCFRDNQLNYLKQRNETLKVSKVSCDSPHPKFSYREDSSTLLLSSPLEASSSTEFNPQSESDTTNSEKCQSNRIPPSRPPLPDILSSNSFPSLSGVMKTNTKSAASIAHCSNKSNLNSQNIVSYPAALNPFEDDSPCDSSSKLECKHHSYNPFDDDSLTSDLNKTDNVTVSISSDRLNLLNSPSLVSIPNGYVNKQIEQSEPNFSRKHPVSNESLNQRSVHSSICDLSSLLAYGYPNKAPSSPLNSQSLQSSNSRLNGSNTKVNRSVGTKGPAPPIPVLCRREVRRSDFISYSELHKKLYDINNELSSLELSARQIQTSIKKMSEDDGNVKELLKQWLHTVQLKDNLFKKESELLHRLRCQELEDHHAELEYELRALMVKQDNLKTKEEKAREEELIADLIHVVDKRAELSESISDVKTKHRARSTCRKILEDKFKKMCLTLSHPRISQRRFSFTRDKSLSKERKLKTPSIFRLKSSALFR